MREYIRRDTLVFSAGGYHRCSGRQKYIEDVVVAAVHSGGSQLEVNKSGQTTLDHSGRTDSTNEQHSISHIWVQFMSDTESQMTNRMVRSADLQWEN